MNDVDIEKELPFPFKIEIVGESDFFHTMLDDRIDNLIFNHNSNHDTKVDGLFMGFLSDSFRDIEENEYKIYVGEELLYKGPENLEEDIFLYDSYYDEIVEKLEMIVDSHHDRIVELQEKNKMKVKKLEKEENYEMLYLYYNLNENKNAFHYLKKLVERYPHSHYRGDLIRIYRRGRKGWHDRNKYLAQKMGRRAFSKDF